MALNRAADGLPKCITTRVPGVVAFAWIGLLAVLFFLERLLQALWELGFELGERFYDSQYVSQIFLPLTPPTGFIRADPHLPLKYILNNPATLILRPRIFRTLAPAIKPWYRGSV